MIDSELSTGDTQTTTSAPILDVEETTLTWTRFASDGIVATNEKVAADDNKEDGFTVTTTIPFEGVTEVVPVRDEITEAVQVKVGTTEVVPVEHGITEDVPIESDASENSPDEGFTEFIPANKERTESVAVEGRITQAESNFSEISSEKGVSEASLEQNNNSEAVAVDIESVEESSVRNDVAVAERSTSVSITLAEDTTVRAEFDETTASEDNGDITTTDVSTATAENITGTLARVVREANTLTTTEASVDDDIITLAFTTEDSVRLNSDENCRKILPDQIPECGSGEEIKFDPFGKAICVCRMFHLRLLDDVAGSDLADVDPDVTSDDDFHESVNEILGKISQTNRTDCYLAGTKGKSLDHAVITIQICTFGIQHYIG